MKLCMKPDRVLIASRLIADVEDERPVKNWNADLVRVIKDAEQSIEYDHCVICKIAQIPQRGSGLQEHHIAGKVLGRPNHQDTVTICDWCHKYLCDHQRAWLLCRRDNLIKLSSYFFGWADIFDLLFNLSGCSYFEELASKFRSQGWHIRNNRKLRHAARLKRVLTA